MNSIVGDIWVRYHADIGPLKKKADEANRVLDRAKQSMERAGQRMQDVGRTMTRKVTVPIMALGAAVAGTGVAYNTLEQTSRAAFTTILGSAEAANKMMDDLMAFAKTSPFPRQAFIEATQQMLGFGFAAEEIIPTLAVIQDAVAAMGGSANEITLLVDVFAKIQSTGRVMADDLNRLSAVGINAWQLLADASGVSIDIMRKTVSKGAVDAEFAIGAMTQGMQEKFGGASENVKKTWAGTADRVKAAWRDVTSAIVEPFISKEGGGLAVEWGNKIADAMRRVEGVLQNVSPQVIALGVALAAAAAAAGPVMWALGGALSALGTILSPAGLVVGGLAALAAAFLGMRNRAKEDTDQVAADVLNMSGRVNLGLNDIVQNGLTPTSTALQNGGQEWMTYQATTDTVAAAMTGTVTTMAGDVHTSISGIATDIGTGKQAWDEYNATVGLVTGAASESVAGMNTDFHTAVTDITAELATLETESQSMAEKVGGWLGDVSTGLREEFLPAFNEATAESSADYERLGNNIERVSGGIVTAFNDVTSALGVQGEGYESLGQIVGSVLREIVRVLNWVIERKIDFYTKWRDRLTGLANDTKWFAGDVKRVFRDLMRTIAGAINTVANGMNSISESLGLNFRFKTINITQEGAGAYHLQANTGALVPGDGPDKDSVPALLTPGEFVVRRKAVQQYGVDTMQAINSGQVDPHALHLNTGGLVLSAAKSAVTKLLSTVTGIPGFDKLREVVGSVLEKFTGPARNMMNAVGKGFGPAGEMVAGGGNKLLDEVIDWVKGLKQSTEEAAGPGGPIPGGPGIGGGIGVAAMMNILRGPFPGLRLISGYRPGAITATGRPSYHGMNRAVDVPPRMDVGQWIRSNYGSRTRELIFSPMGGNQINNGRNHMYSGITRSMHWDHVHWAMNKGGLVDALGPLATLNLGGRVRGGDGASLIGRLPALHSMAAGGVVTEPIFEPMEANAR